MFIKPNTIVRELISVFCLEVVDFCPLVLLFFEHIIIA